MDKNDFVFLAIIAVLFFRPVSAISLGYGECQTYSDSNGTAIEYCAPAMTPDVVQLHFPDFGISPFLNYTCHSGEHVINSPPYNFTTTIYQNVSTCQNQTIYVNATQIVQNYTTSPRVFDQKMDLAAGEEFLDFDSKLQIKCAPFPKINDNKILNGGEIAKYENYNLIVACSNSTNFCPAGTIPTQINNDTYCENKVISAVYNATLDLQARYQSQATPTPQPQQGGFGNNDLLLIGGVVIALALWYFDSQRKLKDLNKDARELNDEQKVLQ